MAIRRAVKLLTNAGLNDEVARQHLEDKTIPIDVAQRALSLGKFEQQGAISPTARAQFRSAMELIQKSTAIDRNKIIG